MSINIDSLMNSISEMAQIAERCVDFFDNVQRWINNNKSKIENTVQAVTDFAIWSNTLREMENKQIIFTDHLSLKIAKDFLASNNIEEAVWKYYTENSPSRLDELIERCRKSNVLTAGMSLFEQAVSSFHVGYYQLACTGLFALMDGILADASGIIYNQSYKKRFDAIEEKLNNRLTFSDMELKLFCVLSGINTIKDTIFGNSDFTKPEPKGIINRHWVLHGRTTREYNKIDVLKLFLTLDAIIFLSEICDKPIIEEKEA